MTAAARPRPDDELVATLVRVFGRVARRMRPTADELSAGHFSTLATLERIGPHKASELARVERMAPPSMTRVVQALEGRGLAERVRSADDGRCVLVSITAAGRTLLAEAQTHRARVVRELLDALTPDERSALDAAAPALAALAEAATDTSAAARDAGADRQSSTRR